MKKVCKIVFLSIIAILLAACSTNHKESFSNSEPKHLNLENYPEPSKMSLLTTDGLFDTKRGSYSWSVRNEKTKETVTKHVDIVGPLELVKVDDALPLTIAGEISYKFDFEPKQVSINVWNQDGSLKTYSSISEIQERGKYVLEFVSEFEQGTVTYVNAFDLK